MAKGHYIREEKENKIMNLPLHHLESLRGYRLDSEDVAIIKDILGPELLEHGISFCNISRKEENEEVFYFVKFSKERRTYGKCFSLFINNS